MAVSAETWERERLLEALDSYTRGLSEPPHLRKWSGGSSPTFRQATDRDEVASPAHGAAQMEDAMTFVASTEEVDRHGDVVLVKGWRLGAYGRNPVFLWAHDYTQPAIGRALNVWKEERSLLARIQFAPTEFAREVAALYQGGYQKGMSVGFRPLQYEVRRDGQSGEVLGITFIEQELLEISAAPVPANQNALLKALDGAPRLRGYYFYRGFGESGAVGNPLDSGAETLPGRNTPGVDLGGTPTATAEVAWSDGLEEILHALRSARGVSTA